MIPAALLLFVTAGDEQGPAMDALLRALADSLGAHIPVVVRSVDGEPDDSELARLGRAESALATARVSWDNAERSQASVLVLVVGTSQAHRRRVTFQRTDPAWERGRALGFVIASYLLPVVPRAPPPATATAAPTLAVAPAGPTLPSPSPWLMDAFAAGGLPVAGSGAGLGGGIGLRRRLADRWGLRLGLRARVGTVSAAQATLTSAALAAGLVRLLAGGAPGRFSLGLRLETSVLYETLIHWSADDPQPVRRARALPGAGSFIEVTIPLGASSAVYFGVGAEAAFGTTDVFVRQVKVARLPPLRGIGEAGLQARF